MPAAVRIASFLRALAVILLIGLFLFGPIALTGWRVLQHASGYREEQLLVQKRNCIGGESTTDTRGRTSTSPRYCFVEGEIDGASASLSVGSTMDGAAEIGAHVHVLYNPDLPEYGINYEPMRVIPYIADLRSTYTRRLMALLQLEIVALGMAGLLFASAVFGAWRVGERGPRLLAADAGEVAAPGTGLVMAALGLSLLLAQIPNPAWGGVVFSIVLTAIGVPLLLRRYVRVDAGAGRITRGLHLLGFHGKGRDAPIAKPLEVVVGAGEGGSFVTASWGDDGTESQPIAARLSRRAARELAAGLGALWSCTVRTIEPAPRRISPRKAASIGIAGLLLLGTAALLAVPGARRPLCALLVAPGAQGPHAALRPLAVRGLAADPSDAATLVLLRIVATSELDPGDAMRGVALEALRARGAPTEQQGDVDALYAWAAKKLARPLDASGGILQWFPVDAERYRRDLDLIASSDRREGWDAWERFAIGDVQSPEQLLWIAGAALGDTRPLHFAMPRQYALGHSFPPDWPQALEGAPEVLAHTVGESMAVQLWKYIEQQELPEDFHAWWHEYAQTHHLPPGGCDRESDR